MQEVVALGFSVAVEAPIAAALVKAMAWPCRGALHAGLAAAVATAVTHPQLWQAAQWAYPRFGVWPSVAMLETGVIAAEALLIAWMAGLALHRALIISFVVNIASSALGIALFW